MDRDYSKTKVYKITCDVDPRVYVGHTTVDLDVRFMRHKCSTGQRFCEIMKDIGYRQFSIHLLEERPCADVTEARAAESEWMHKLRSLDPEHGFNLCDTNFYGSERQRAAAQKQRDKFAESGRSYAYHKQYREEHRDEIRERKRKYREEHKEEIAAHKKAYAEENKEAILAKSAARRAVNREELNAAKRASYRAARDADPEGVAARQRAAYERRFAKDPEAVRAYARAQYHKHKQSS